MIIKHLDPYQSDAWRFEGKPSGLLHAVANENGVVATSYYHDGALREYKAMGVTASRVMHGFYDPANEVFYNDFDYDEWDLR